MTEQPANSQQAYFFVYGTLKSGQCRESCWPADAAEVRQAEVNGLLYDLGPYPALRDGEGRVTGELWVFDCRHEAAILRVLDKIEGYANSPRDLYRRVRIPVRCGDRAFEAWTYFICAEPPESSRIRSVPAIWPLS